ncbi:RNA-binding protein NOB1 isoform X1 [Cylas formicarius]|uniref:RNA-binding protein NOB1 isoform X1 n=1 Tax=Cylas formicarius TaxID=197179 RepID=UPI0029586368|nr:RNA-binding protein NOB1 isoform X1 [Cylas formicarius]
MKKSVEYLVADTTAFIQQAPLHEVADVILTCQEVLDEITNRRQLRRLVTLPFDLVIKEVFPDNVKLVTEFAKKTGDYPSLSATDIKVISLTYQLQKEKVGTNHLRSEPILQKPLVTTENPDPVTSDITGFFAPNEIDTDNKAQQNSKNLDSMLAENFEKLVCDDSQEQLNDLDSGNDYNESGWITPSNISVVKTQLNSQLMEEKHVPVACMTTDFAMQNVLKQMNLNVAALNGHLIKQLKTYILRCYACFKTTSIMTKKFCPKCGNDTLKKVAISLDDNGEMKIHINLRRPLTARGKKFSLPTIKGGKHPNNPILVEDQPMPDNKPTRLAKTKTNPLDDDYIAGYSPFAVRDINSKSAQLGIRPGSDLKYWMKQNPNESRKKKH